jgi:hypothetical protein
VPEALLFIVAGFHVPAIPLSDADGKEGTEAPAQIVSELPMLNVGVNVGFTVTFNVAVFEH